MSDPKTVVSEGAQRDASTEFHAVFGAGGSKAILGAVGAIAGFDVCGFTKFATIGGVSGGSIPAALFANGMSAQELLMLAVRADFSKFLIAKSGWLSRAWAMLSKYRYERTMPKEGVYSAKPLRDLVDLEVPSWPKGYWTMATSMSGHSVLFTHEGTFWNWDKDGCCKPDGFEGPVSVGTAVNASCAIPGIIDAVETSGWYLFDGAIGDAGNCPTAPLHKQLGVKPSQIIAFDIPDDMIKKARWLRFLWHLRCGGTCGNIDATHPTEDDGTIVISPSIDSFHGLTFDLSYTEKWHAITASYIATVRRLDKAGLIRPDCKDRALALCRELEKVSFTKGIGNYPSGVARQLFASHGFTTDN
ncbi:MAG: patatin-like phospholipase family protein [Candidatus Obscuribacterales bacterium]|nr:patatin-like phospholipase family protein [Candidatus Obscuribacterales bacterium]